MEKSELNALYKIVRAQLSTEGVSAKYVAQVIQEAHDGQLHDFVTDQNSHLFRRYRNDVSPDPLQLLREAVKATAVPLVPATAKARKRPPSRTQRWHDAVSKISPSPSGGDAWSASSLNGGSNELVLPQPRR